MKLQMLTFLLALSFLSCEINPIEPVNGGNGSGAASETISMRTTFSNDWDRWEFKIGDLDIDVRTIFTDDWDDWELNGDGFDGEIETNFSNDFDRWKLTCNGYTIRIETSFSDDWDNWDIDDNSNDLHADVRTSFSEDWDNWDVNMEGNNIDLRTAFSEDYDSWNCYGDFPENTPTEFKLAVLFVPVVTNVLRQQGLIE